MHAGRGRTAGIEQDRVAVGFRLGDILDRDRPGRTNLILDNDGTTDDRAQLLGKETRDDVGTLLLARAVELFEAVDACISKMLGDVASGVGEFRDGPLQAANRAAFAFAD